MELVAIVAALALLEYVVIFLLTGRARLQYGVEAPATTGHPTFERYFRVQQNTLEQLILFLPSLWLFGRYVSAPIAAITGVVFILGRAVYLISYVRDPKRRGAGFVLTLLASLVLLVGGLIGAALAL